MPRGDRNEEIEEGKKEEGRSQEQGVMEVEINHTLLNNKLNYIIAQLEGLAKQKE